MVKEIDTERSLSAPFRLDEWLVEPTLNRVSRDEVTVQLEHRVMAVLMCLAGRAGELVTRQDLVDCVWEKGFVSDNTITHAITELRKAFGDDARDPRFIETIHRRGYRLVASVTLDRPTLFMSEATPYSFLVVLKDLEIALHEGANVIGRAPDAAITIPSMKASRHHARINITGGSASLEDLDSKNGTFLNGKRIQQELPLNSGDLIGIGTFTETIRFVNALGGVTTESEYDA
jgi:DNA-binding winged helix-turn-helix (wHTH) protein